MGKPEYYEAGYYNSVPPRSEIYGYDEQPHHYRQGKKKVQAAAESSVSETKAVPNNVKKQS